MIRRHDANSEWCGQEVAIITGPEFFAFAPAERQELLAPYAWAEWKSQLPSTFAEQESVRQSGFYLADYQVAFTLDLTRAATIQPPPGLTLYAATERPFTIDVSSIRSYRNERFADLPGMTQELLDGRYVTWSNQLIAKHPDYALEARLDGAPQGWYFAQPGAVGAEGSNSVDLVLAMLHAETKISGRILYSAAYRWYYEHGVRSGYASFSASNLAVLNILSGLGARFTSTTACWLWVRDRI